MRQPPVSALVLTVMLALALVAPGSVAQEPPPIPNWPAHYNSQELLTYNLELSQADWDFVLQDLTETYVPALFWATGDEYGYAPDSPILIAVRRKSCTELTNDPVKVSLKIDINKYYDDDTETCEEDHGFANPTCVDTWHQLKKLDLENGDDANVVVEGLAYYLHQLASESELDYAASKTSWVKLNVTLTGRTDANGNPLPDYTLYQGVYVNLEQRDDQFLKNHGLWMGSDDTWLYKYGDPFNPEVKEAPEDEFGEPIDSPNFEALYYSPFQDCDDKHVDCLPQPSDDQFVTQLNERINMEGMLTYAAVSAFHISPDDLFSKGKNFFLVDYSNAVMADPAYKREYIQWDLDSAFAGMDEDADIYNQARRFTGGYEDWIIDNPVFREQYNGIMQYLLDGPFAVSDLQADLTAFEALLTPALEADANNQIGEQVSGYFQKLRDWLAARAADVQNQLPTCGSPHDVSFTWNPPTPFAGDPITFTSAAQGTLPLTYEWHWGDGTTGDGQQVQHTYAQPGSYEVTLTVGNNCGTAKVEHTVTVQDQPPTCDPPHDVSFTWDPPMPSAGDPVTFTSAAQGTLPLAYEWDWGDSTTGDGQQVQHTYAQPGSYEITLTVGNDCGTATAEHTVTIHEEGVPYRIFLPLLLHTLSR